MTEQIDYALDLMRRLPPKDVLENLTKLIDACPDLAGELLANVDMPLRIIEDKKAKKSFLICDYNRDGDSFRSPFSNTYFPPMDSDFFPSDKLRQLEVQLNDAFEMYREMYYEEGLHSVYVWDTDDGFNVCALFKKTARMSKKGAPMTGTWDSINVIEVIPQGTDKAQYTITSTIMMYMKTSNDTTGEISFTGSLTRQNSKVMQTTQKNAHVINIGSYVEDVENQMRSIMDAIYFSRSKDITNACRCQIGASQQNLRNEQIRRINTQLQARND